MEFLLTAVAQLGAAFLIALAFIVVITIVARRYLGQVATKPIGTIIIAGVAVLIHLSALLWVI